MACEQRRAFSHHAAGRGHRIMVKLLFIFLSRWHLIFVNVMFDANSGWKGTGRPQS
jgi:hypothetical protein